MKLIVEGMFQDNTRLNYDIYPAEIPEDINRIAAVNQLDLVGRISEEGGFSPVEFDKGNIKEIDIGYSPFTGIQSPMSIVTEDGRVYHDKNLRDKERLPTFLRTIRGEGGIAKSISALEKFYAPQI